MLHHPVNLLVLAGVAASLDAGSERSWASPQETLATFMAEQRLEMGFSPKPTPAPQPRDLFGRMLMPRLEGYTLGPATCGFVQSNGSPFTCVANTATCTTVGGYLGCCQPNQECARIQTVCMDYAASKSGKCDLLSDFHTVCCSSAAPSCFTFLVTKTDAGKDKGSTLTALACSTTAGTAALLDFDPAWSRTHSFPPTTASSTDRPSTTSATHTPAATETGGGGDGGGKPNLGAIIGGTVGGVAGLVLVGLAVGLLVRRRKTDRVLDTQDSPQTSMTQSQPQSPPPQGYPQGYSPLANGYDAHTSISSQQAYSLPGAGSQQYPQQFQGQYPSQHYSGHPPYGGAAGFPSSLTGSPPPLTTPSPNYTIGGEATPGATPAPAGHQQYVPPSELQAGAPLGNEHNRAELS